MNPFQRIAEYLEALGLAIVDAGYTWTPEMRKFWEVAYKDCTGKPGKAPEAPALEPGQLPTAVAEWLKTLEWVGPIRRMSIEYPAGRPDGLLSSERNDYYEAITAAGPDECLYVQITDTTYGELFGVDVADHSHEPDHHLYADCSG